MFDVESAEVDDWAEIEASISVLRPDLVPLDPLFRYQIEERLLHFCYRRIIERDSVPKSELIREHDLLIKRSGQMIQALERMNFNGASYELLDDDGVPSGEQISIRQIVRILESIYWAECQVGELIEKGDEPDPVPARKRLGISLFLLGERAFCLSSKRTTPPDRGARKPTGALFGFVIAVLKQVDEEVSATTLEQWSRDAQVAKREIAAQEIAREAERQRVRQWIAKHGNPLPPPDRPGTHLANAPHRDWLFSTDD